MPYEKTIQVGGITIQVRSEKRDLRVGERVWIRKDGRVAYVHIVDEVEGQLKARVLNPESGAEIAEEGLLLIESSDTYELVDAPNEG